MAKKILLIEDEEIILSFLRRKLTEEGYKVYIARDGEDGLRAMKEVIPDLILLDIVLPKRGGFEVMEEIIKEEKLKEIPIIVLSNLGEKEELEKAKKLGAKDWIIKTEFNSQEIIEKVLKQIGK